MFGCEGGAVCVLFASQTCGFLLLHSFSMVLTPFAQMPLIVKNTKTKTCSLKREWSLRLGPKMLVFDRRVLVGGHANGSQNPLLFHYTLTAPLVLHDG